MNRKGQIMGLVYIVIGIIIGLGLAIFLDVGSFVDKFAKREEQLDDKAEHTNDQK